MTTQELTDLYLDKHPPVSGLVKEMLHAHAEAMVRTNTYGCSAEYLTALELALSVSRKSLYNQLSPIVIGQSKINFTYRGQTFLVCRQVLSELKANDAGPAEALT